ncbi:LysR family transcriptional regulator [Zestomonas carbonaria]|uniref:HTH-type transcriptional regulator DmlR n=1 Tax=Zestomonas carbonaria TaxID=2762745 RepID=A0A7U7I8V5_9GAMM|nr:LysR family transcriptional regulator [Pseudomonas carbonaria]CAD5107561.1 HTH-type transcriptional regulator DmlR [Pseudomonas carbonaria]
METLANLESFVRSAESGSFSAAARRLGLTPAAVSRNVAQLESNLGVRLFQRSTRRLTLTEAGERFLHSVSGGLDSIQAAIADLTSNAGQPAGVLKLGAAPAFARDYLLPLMPTFLECFPAVTPDWHLDNRQVDLIAEGFDVAIGGGFELTPGVVARRLAPAHLVVVASPGYLRGRRLPRSPGELTALDCLAMRSSSSGRVRSWTLRNAGGGEHPLELRPRMTLDDADALCRCVLLDMGVALLAVPDVLAHLESGALLRLLPDWYVDAGPISLYFGSQKLLPAKTRAFVDFIAAAFREHDWETRFAAGAGKRG